MNTQMAECDMYADSWQNIYEVIMRKKYQYIIECNGSGGELSIHSITQEFFDFMDAMSEDEKNDCITKLYQDQASLESLPQIKPDEENNEYFEWHEGDIKHVSLPSEIELSFSASRLIS